MLNLHRWNDEAPVPYSPPGNDQDDHAASTLGTRHGVPAIALGRFDLDPSALALVPAETARKRKIVPLSRSGGTLTVALADPTDVVAMDDVKFLTGCHIEPVVATESAMIAALDKYYGRPTPPRAPARPSALEAATRALAEMPLEMPDAGGEDVEEISADALGRAGNDAPVVRLVHVILMSAIQKGASDVHIEPYEKELRVRCRIDGVLHPVMQPPLRLRDAITSRVKIMARLDIAEKRLPQDGRLRIRFQERGRPRAIDVRVSCLPTLFGEKIVMRLLDKDALVLDMTALGFESESLVRFEAAIARPWGLVLVTGPTGSGKTNTLYSSIARINTPGTNILTAEDPVEFNLAGINQLQVREQIGLGFATALRSFLRQDPNIILVGEIRDRETAEIAVRAALTGHLVLSTLHTNDAPSTISRLIDMGIEPFLVASALNLVCAQRLVRRICTSCSAPHPTPAAALEQAGFSSDEAAAVVPQMGLGCERCSHTGYKGRVGLFEVMEITEPLRERMLAGAPAPELRRSAMAAGMLTLRQSGLRKVAGGVTTIEEVVRETVR